MYHYKLLLVIGAWLITKPVYGLWSCSSDLECSSLSGSVCDGGSCICPLGTQAVSGGTLCAQVAPYHTSPCVEDHQCQRLFTSFQCRRNFEEAIGSCRCQPGHHFLNGRCWRSIEFGEECSRDEECFGPIRDPNSLRCDGACRCADGYLERQRGECRRAAFGVGDGCVLDQDCQFLGGACNLATFTCFNATASQTELGENQNVLDNKMAAAQIKMEIRQQGAACGVTNPCESPLVCASFGICVCPLGYYASDDGSMCLAELESPSSEEQCTGLFATVRDGICTCPANFFFEESMRDCVKVARFITDACVSDETCHTFGAAARCGAPQPPWGMRSCQCEPELAVWDAQRSMCRLFAGIGETCEVDSDCLAGELEIQCVRDEQGHGVCTCPDGHTEFEGLCITTGLELGEACQVSEECTGAANSVCADGRCACDSGYQQVGDSCAPMIGGSCSADEDCAIEHTVCRNDSGVWTCRCGDGFVQGQDVCWPEVSGNEAPCNVSEQCAVALGDASRCADGLCACVDGHHYRDERCWPKTGLFESCSRHSQCFLGELTDRVVCRNSLCQCDFQFPYSEELHTCRSSASANTISYAALATITTLFIYNLL